MWISRFSEKSQVREEREREREREREKKKREREREKKKREREMVMAFSFIFPAMRGSIWDPACQKARILKPLRRARRS